MTDVQSQHVNKWISESIDFFQRFGLFSEDPESEDWRMEYFERDLPETKEGEYEFLDQLLLGKDKKECGRRIGKFDMMQSLSPSRLLSASPKSQGELLIPRT